MLVESSPGSLDDVVLIAGGGGGGEDGGTFSSGDNGDAGGIAAASVIGMGFIGVGQGKADGPEGGSTSGDGIGGSGGTSDADGNDGIGGEGGKGFLGTNSQWFNGDPGVGSNGRGGNSSDSGNGCAGGGGYGGGGGASTSFFGGGPAAGGGSWARVPTSSCSLAPNFDTAPSNPGTTHDDFGSLNGAVEIWIFPDGC